MLRAVCFFGLPTPALSVILEKLTGKLSGFYEEFCLLEQPFIKAQALTIGQLIASKIVKLGENISVCRFARFKIGDPNYTIAPAKVSMSEETAAYKGVDSFQTIEKKAHNAGRELFLFLSTITPSFSLENP